MTKNILWLPSWYPSRVSAFNGDFIERHAQCASLFNKITVFYTVKDISIKKSELVIKQYNENLVAYIFYYPPAGISFLQKPLAAIKRLRLLKQLYRDVFQKNAPDLVHVHVAWPAGLFALYLKRTKKIEFIISEHDGMYMPGYDDYHIPGSFEKRNTPRIFKNSKAVHTVSKALSDGLLQRDLISKPAEVIPNVVDTSLFVHVEKQQADLYRFIHVSSLINQKNPEGMLRGFAIIKSIRNDFKLTIVGPVNQRIRNLAGELGLTGHVDFLGEIPHPEVAKQMQQADALIQFSRYETFGCVIAESLCCGIPVIVSDLEVIHEIVRDNIDGIFVEPQNEQELADKIIRLMKGEYRFDGKQIAMDSARRFNYQAVGNLFDKWYGRI
jgi:glycosyltransferase involved in cell wall biosynthesis